MASDPKRKMSEQEIIEQDVKDLHKLGYAQQLYREMGGFANFAISFSIISILTGAILLFGYGLKFGGPIINTVGWPVVSLFTLAVAASMSQIASCYPTTGGLYYWAFRLGGKTWAWVTAWLNMLGQVTITAGINVAAAMYLVGFMTNAFSIPADTHIPLFGTLTSWWFYLFVTFIIMIPQVWLNIYGIKVSAKLNDFSVWWHIGGVVLMAFLLTIFGKHHNSLSFMFSSAAVVKPEDVASSFAVGTLTVPSIMLKIIPGLDALYKSGVIAFAFVLGLLQAQWTYTGYDASAHMAEETRMARLNSAWGVFLSVAVSFVVGYVSLLVLTWCIPDITATANDAYPVLYICRENLPAFMSNLIGLIIAVAMWLCGQSSITSMARMWFAFARDHGMPGSKTLGQISHKHRVPTNAILITSVIALLLCVWAPAFWVVTSISTMALYLAYVIPTYLNLRNMIRKRGEYTTAENSPWWMGKWGPFVNVVAIVWVVFISILFSLPPNELAGWTMLGLGILLVIYWYAYEKRHFVGPHALSSDEIAGVEKEYL